MVATLVRDAAPLVSGDSAGEGYGGWQSMRHQLFGERRRRDAENQLIALVTQLDSQLAAASRQGQHRTARAAVLNAVLAATNTLLAWQQEQVEASRLLGECNEALSNPAGSVLSAVANSFPLFENCVVRNGRLDCADVVDAVGQLRGEGSDAFFSEALDGVASLIDLTVRALYDHPATSAPALALEPTWRTVQDTLATLRPPDRPAEKRLSPVAAPPVAASSTAARPMVTRPMVTQALVAPPVAASSTLTRLAAMHTAAPQEVATPSSSGDWTSAAVAIPAVFAAPLVPAAPDAPRVPASSTIPAMLRRLEQGLGLAVGEQPRPAGNARQEPNEPQESPAASRLLTGDTFSRFSRICLVAF